MEESFEVVIKWLRKLADDIEAGTAKPGDLNISSEMREKPSDSPHIEYEPTGWQTLSLTYYVEK